MTIEQTEPRTPAERWGSDDERGALNLLTPETVLAALGTPRTGKIYRLGLPVQRAGVPLVDYRGTPQRLTLLNQDDEHMWVPYGGQPGTGAHEDMLVLASHTSTHMDALCHVFSNAEVYNGFPASGMTPFAGAEHCGIEKAGPIVTRGVLVDVARSKGVDWLEPGYIITVEDLEQAMRDQEITPRAGDVIVVRTGWLDWFFAHDAQMSLEQPGIGLAAAQFLAGFDPVAVASDNTAVEAQPFDEGAFLGVHVELLAKRGIYLIEHLDLRELVVDGCREFLFGVSPLVITGATASPVSPFAIG